jgi:RimJ/RimL family protein N-acetyltransferase
MNPTPILETTRLLLRPRGPDDAVSLFPTLADPEAMRWWSRAPLTSLEETHAYLAEGADQNGWRAWYVTLKGSDRAIGWISVGTRKQTGVSEIGYLIAREHWRGGIAREAVARVLDQLFAVEKQRRIFADIDPENAGSRALMEKLGFTLEGRLRGEWETHIGIRDSLIYGLLREEWTCARHPI